MQDNTLSIIAKLLANENINMYRGRTSTAFFDMKNRTLVLPTWQNLTDSANEMLVAHEVGHALFTPQDYCDHVKSLDFKYADAYVNIIEDARIEKLVKQRYPGLRKTFHEGYSCLQELDLLGVKNRDVNSMSLIDRINIFYKAGYQAGVQFTAEEKTFINRIDNISSFDDVVTLSKEIYEYDYKQKQQQHIEQMNYSDPDGDEEFDDDPADCSMGQESGCDDELSENNEDDFEEGSSTEQSKGTGGFDQTNDTEPFNSAPLTNTNLSQQLKVLADSSTIFTYSVVEKTPYNPIVSYKKILDDADHYHAAVNVNAAALSAYEESVNNRTKEFMDRTENNVSYLVKEFEMRKAAQSYKRATLAKTGSIDTTKLWGYKIKDDIFRRLTVTKDGQNHGMVFLLDWSGSMAGVMSQTIDQLINLVSFCRRSKIPYRVYAFTDNSEHIDKFIGHTANHDTWPLSPKHDHLNLVSWSRFMLLEFFNSEMNNADHLKMIKYFKSRLMMDRYRMCGTPLVSALGHMLHEIDNFQKKHNVQKLTFITLSDGCSTTIYPHVMVNGLLQDSRYVESQNYIVDPVTKKQVLWKNMPYQQVNAMLDLIKARYGCKAIGFFVTSTSRRDLFSAIYDTTGVTNYPIDTVKSEFNKNGVFKIKNTSYDELFLIPWTTKIAPDEMGIDSNRSSKGIAKQFSKFMNGQKTSRYMLNAFVEQIA